jgi:hypothetical protein
MKVKVSLSPSLSFSFSVCSVYVPVCLYVPLCCLCLIVLASQLVVFLSVSCVSVCLCVCLFSVYLFFRLCVLLSVCLPAYLFMYSLPVLLILQCAHSISRQIRKSVPFVCIIFMLIPTPIVVFLLRARQKTRRERQHAKENNTSQSTKVKV